MKSFKQYLGPQATKSQDKKEITRQKKHLDQKTAEYNQMSKDEGGGGMAKAHADMFANTKKAIHTESFPSVEALRKKSEEERGTGKFDKKKDPTTGGTIHSVKYDKETGETPYKLKPGQHKQDQEILHTDSKALRDAWSKKSVKEDGMAGGMNVAAVAGTGDSRLPASQREPGVSKKHNPIIQKLARRALPKV